MSSRRPLATIEALFFLSGLASLVYQVAWQRLLAIHLGSGAVSITLIVSVFMLGLGLGSLAGARLADRSANPLRLYGFVQLALGAAGVASFRVLFAAGSAAAVLPQPVTFALAFAVLLVPTLLMGTSLPLLAAAAAHATPDFLYSVSRLYAVNTLGAAAGALLTGYVFVSLLGLNGSIYLAAFIDLALAAAILRLARAWDGRQASVPSRGEAPLEEPALGRLAFVLVFATGFVAIGYEIVWYRLIGVLVKDSPYAFSSVLAVYLLGIAVGSVAVHPYLRSRPSVSRRDVFFALQFLIGLAVVVTTAGFYHLLPYAPLRWFAQLSFATDLHPSLVLFAGSPGRSWVGDAFLMVDVFIWPMALMFVPTALMGASFPLIASLALARRGREGAAAGTTYAFCVLGNVLGGLVTGLVLLPAIGTERTVLTFGVVGLAFGLVPALRNSRVRQRVLLVATVLGTTTVIVLVFPRAGALYARMHVPPFEPTATYFHEGGDAVVLAYENGDRLRNYINGQGHGYRPGAFFYEEAIEGLSLARAPRSVLVIGFGAGSVAEASLALPEVERVTIVELCASVITTLRNVAALGATLDDRRVEVVIDDGRRFLERTDRTYDLILMDPVRTTTAYSNNLHSRQFFGLAAAHLRSDGVLMVGGVGETRVIARTLLEVFRVVRSYPNSCLASQSALTTDRARFARLSHAFLSGAPPVMESHREQVLEGPALVAATAGDSVNEDWDPVSEYYLALPLRRWLRSLALLQH